MIPRLAPRRSSRMSREASGIENASPFLPSPKPSTYNKVTIKSSVTAHPARREVLSHKQSSINPPLSPSPSLEPLDLKSPLPSEYSDCSLTPPATGPRPLVVSAKRLGNDVRRRHSKRRRCRTKGTDGGFCLWKDANAPPSQESDSEEELPFLFSLPLQKRTQHYWEFCYGTTTIQPCPSWSANRKPPTKGCLSHKKLPKSHSQNDAHKFHTPPTPEDTQPTAMTLSHKRSNRVQFGSPQAVEYEVDGPTAHLTPLPSEVTRKRYSMDPKGQTQEEEEMTIETKRNSAILAEWEDEVQATSSASRRRQQKKNRRSSSLFTPSPMTLLQDDEEHPSPSAIVMENLASLCVDSPAEKASDPPILTPISSSTSSSSSDHVASETAEFAINLVAVNTNGGAMDVSPPRQDDGVTTDTTPPPSNLNLIAIHSVGGALDRASPETFALSKVHSPISRMNESSNHAYFKGIATSAPTDIVSLLLQDPSLDRGWDALDIFQNLSRLKPRTNPVKSLLSSIIPQLDGIMSCLDDLKEQAQFCASTKSNTKFKLPSTEVRYARRLAMQEWKELESEFFVDLAEVLERNVARMTTLLQQAGALLERPKSRKFPKQRFETKQLEREIAQLERQIDSSLTLAKVEEAASAPLAVLYCQATSHIGVCGFRLDEYTGSCLQLSYEHPIAGVESQFIFDLTDASWKAVYISDAFISSPNLIPANHAAAKFHNKLATACFADSIGLLRELQELDVREAIMLLSRWLGLLDSATQELAEVAADHSIVIDWPRVNVSISSKCSLELSYDNTVYKNLRPTKALVSTAGKEQDLKLPRGTDCFKSIIVLVSSAQGAR